MNKEKKEEIKTNEEKDNKDTKTSMRQIVIETDGNSINIVKAEVMGTIELTGILQNIINHINTQKEQ